VKLFKAAMTFLSIEDSFDYVNPNE